MKILEWLDKKAEKATYWLNDHWPWWKEKIWGKSKSWEDFKRNPAEVLRDTTFPFCIKDVRPLSLINVRTNYIAYSGEREPEYCLALLERAGLERDMLPMAKTTYWQVPMGEKRKFIKEQDGIVKYDVRLFNPFFTKYVNGKIFFQITGWMPYVAFVYRISEKKFFQFGLGWGLQLRGYDQYPPPTPPFIYDAVLVGKCRINDYESERIWNPSDVFGFYEGTI